MKLYLLISAVYFFLAWGSLLNIAEVSEIVTSQASFERLAQVKNRPPAVLAERFDGDFARYTSYLNIASVLLFGVFVALFYRGSGRRYVGHLIFALHFFSFSFLLITLYVFLLLGLSAVSGSELPFWSIYLIYVLSPPYLYFALRRVYGESRRRSAFKALAMFALNMALWAALLFIATFLALTFA